MRLSSFNTFECKELSTLKRIRKLFASDESGKL